ncbi:MAG: zf-HC2 domain-containing protein [Victivallales bacterium]|nr:zf-HC2 domain-containing protein [Victivallales bacterium]
MKENLNDVRECPSFEDISAFLDGELSPDAPVYAHIAACPRCRRRLDEYREIDARIATAITTATPEGLSERIKAAVARENATIRFPHLHRILSLAAAFAVCCGVVFYIVTDKTVPPTVPIGNQQEVALSGTHDDGHAHAVASAPNASAPADIVTHSSPDSAFISAGSLVGASYGGTSAPVFTDAMASIDRRRKPVDIAAQVQQVWAVGNTEDAALLLTGFLKKMHVPENNIRLIHNGNSLRLIAGLTKLELVHLVRACRASGLELLSPAAPQPEQNVFTGKGSTPIVYYAEFVVGK